jgi:hypothetical protein
MAAGRLWKSESYLVKQRNSSVNGSGRRNATRSKKAAKGVFVTKAYRQ